MRFVERDDGGQLDLLVATYRKGDATVTLHAALHVADPEHYQELQRRFTAFDALLYELVAEADLRPHPEMERDDSDLFSQLQGGFGRGLGLVEQVAHIDYRADNFVHADLTDEQWEEALERAGSSLLGEVFSLGAPPEPDREAESKRRKEDFVAALRRGSASHELRVSFARLMAEAEGQRRHPTVIIEARNERCLEVLAQQLAAGNKKLGIYYGAAHMEHMERRLLRDLGWQHTGEEWVMAWDNRRERFPAVEKGGQQKRYRARKDVDALSAALAAWAKEHAGKTPTWGTLRKLQPDGKLPGRADGVDPWGRGYELRTKSGGSEVRCAGPDGALDTEDDLTGENMRVSKPGFFERLFPHPLAVGDALAAADRTMAEIQATRLCAEAMGFRHSLRRDPTLADLDDAPSLDPWRKPYRLTIDADGSVEVRSDGPDRKQGTVDDIVKRWDATAPAKK